MILILDFTNEHNEMAKSQSVTDSKKDNLQKQGTKWCEISLGRNTDRSSSKKVQNRLIRKATNRERAV